MRRGGQETGRIEPVCAGKRQPAFRAYVRADKPQTFASNKRMRFAALLPTACRRGESSLCVAGQHAVPPFFRPSQNAASPTHSPGRWRALWARGHSAGAFASGRQIAPLPTCRWNKATH